ncbi:MAG: M48 family metallopeptidase [Candidatus Methylomirabilales bacterium]
MIDYRLRVSPRARRLSLRVTLRGELEVVVPRRYNLARIPAVLEREQAWIRAALARAERRRQALPPPPAWQIPAQIHLPAVGATWDVAVRDTGGASVRVGQVGPHRLQLAGRVADEPACRQALGRWLVRQSRLHLVPRLESLGRTLGFPCTRTAVRLQRTRWGSCSSRGLISLNARLLLLPAHLVEYVLVHELCHTRELSHSRKFWRLVEQHCPDHRQRRAELRAAGRALPAWAADPRDQAYA